MVQEDSCSLPKDLRISSSSSVHSYPIESSWSISNLSSIINAFNKDEADGEEMKLEEIAEPVAQDTHNTTMCI
jgi:hypothetical protein